MCIITFHCIDQKINMTPLFIHESTKLLAQQTSILVIDTNKTFAIISDYICNIDLINYFMHLHQL